MGSLGAVGRLAWFIPSEFAAKSPPITDHWRAFKSPKVTEKFSLGQADLEVIKALTVDSNGR